MMMNKIKQRQYYLVKDNIKPSNSYKPLLEQVRNTHNLDNAKLLYKHILETDNNLDQSIKNCIDLLIEMYEYHSIADVNILKGYVLEAIPKIRDASEFRDYLSRSLSYHKSRSSNKVSSALKKLKDATSLETLNKKDTKEEPKEDGTNNAEDATNTTSEPAMQSQEEALNMALEMVNDICTYDRIIKNHNIISKRFNLDKYVVSKVFTPSDAVYTARGFCEMVDTYSSSIKDKFKITLENYFYALSRNGCSYNPKDVAKTIANFYLMRNTDDLNFVKEMAKILAESTRYTNLEKEDAKNLVREITTIDILKESDDPLSMENLQKIATNREQINILIINFKNGTDKSLPKWESLIGQIYNISKDIFIAVFPELIETVMAVQDHRKNYIQVCYDFLIDRIFAYDASDLNTIKKMLEEFNKTLYKDLDDLIEYNNQFIQKIDTYTDTDEESPLGPNALNTIVPRVNELERVQESLSKTSSNDLIKLIKRGINTYSNDTLDIITDMTIMFPTYINIDDVKGVFEQRLKDLRSNTNLPSAKKYMDIESLVYNIERLEENNQKVFCDTLNKSTQDLDDLSRAIVECHILLSYRNFLQDYTLYPRLFNEMNIQNTINMAIEKFKTEFSKLSEEEKRLSKKFDFEVDKLKKLVTINIDDENREAVIRGDLLPSASRIIKLAITGGATYILLSPALAVIGIMGYIALSADARSKERRLILDEIDVELDMTDRYLKEAEDNGNNEKIRSLLKIKKKLESQKARLRYNMVFKHGEQLPNRNNTDD